MHITVVKFYLYVHILYIELILEHMLFKRKIYDDLLKWKNEDGGRTVALIEGARRVGKTTVVTEFAKKEYRSCLIINFSEVSEDEL